MLKSANVGPIKRWRATFGFRRSRPCYSPMKSNLRNRLTFTAIIVSCAVLPILAVNLYTAYEHFQEEISQNLTRIEEIARSRNVTLHRVLEEHLHEAEYLARHPSIAALAREWNSQLTPDPVRDSGTAALVALQEVQESRWGASHHIFVTDINGEIRLSPAHGDSTSSHTGQNIGANPYFDPSRPESMVTDFYAFSEKDHNHQLAMAPILSEGGEFLGMVVIEISIDHLQALLNHTDNSGNTAKIFLATLDGIEVAHQTSAQVRTLHQEAVANAVTESVALGEFSYDSKDVIACYLKDTRWDWILAVEIDKEVALQPAFAALRQTLAIVGASLLVTALILLLTVERIIGFFVIRPIAEHFDGVEASIGILRNHVRNMSANGIHLAGSTSAQASILGDTLTSINDLTRKTHENTSSVGELSAIASNARSSSESGKTDAQAMLSSVQQLGESHQEVANIIKTIDEIAFQTNLLALNAAVEAARAGEAGAGFAVVAEEVRNLAHRSAEAARETTGKINATIKDMTAGEKASSQVDRRLGEILENVTRVDGFTEKISTATQEQENNIQRVHETMTRLENMAGANAAAAEETAASSEEILKEASDLEQRVQALLNRFGYKTTRRAHDDPNSGNESSALSSSRAEAVEAALF